MANECYISRWSILKQELKNLSPAAFAEAMEKQAGAILLDCRTPNEFAHSRLPGAINFDYLSPDFVGQMAQLDPKATYFVYCRSERRSIRTCTLLKNGGFENVFNLDGGLQKWVEVFGEQGFDRRPA